MKQYCAAPALRCILGRLVLLLGIAVLFSASAAYGQLDQGTLTGVVTDSTKAAIPDASVTIVNVSTNLTLHQKADGHGVFTFTPIKIGTYSVSATAPGFEKTTQENVVIDVQSNVNVPIILHAGSVSETVTVTTAPPLMQTQDATVGTTFTNQEVNDTPLNSRNWIYMAQMAAGTAPVMDSGTEASGNGDFSANGQRPSQNSFTLDGIDNNMNTVDLRGGQSYAIRPPPDAIAEFRLSTTNFSAQFGHSAGAIFNASVKSGTNHIHGDAWEYFRNTHLDATDWEDLVKDEYHENQFGATIGGPIWRDHIFYFGDGEANRIVYGTQSLILDVPSALEREGNFNELENTTLTGDAQQIQMFEPQSSGTVPLSCNGVQNVLCQSQMDPVAENLLDRYPLPNVNNGLLYNNYRTNVIQHDNTDQMDHRLDFNLTPRDQTFVRYSYSHDVLHNPPPLGPVLDGTTTNLGYEHVAILESFVFSETHIFNPNFTNEARFGYNWVNERFLQLNATKNVGASVGLGGLPFGQPGYIFNGGLPNITVGSISGFGIHEFSPNIEHQNIGQYLDNLSDVVGNHTMKFGVALQSIRSNFLQPTYSAGHYDFSGKYTSNLSASFTGNGVADFLAGDMNTAGITNQPEGNDVRWYDAAYFQDDWRIRNNLTLNLGIRYDYFQPYREMAGQQANFQSTGPLGPGLGTGVFHMPMADQAKYPLSSVFTTAAASNNIAIEYDRNDRLTYSQKTDFSPRVGFAYAIDPTTVFRGGFGLFYGALETFGSAYNLIQNYPFTFSSNPTATTCSVKVIPCPLNGISLESGFAQAFQVGLANYVVLSTLTGVDMHQKNQYTYGMNFTFEKALSSNTVFDVAYVGTYARRIATQEDLNAGDALRNPVNAGNAVNSFTGFGTIELITNTGMSTYNSLQVTLHRRMAHGFNFSANYTWGHAFDDSKQPIGGGPTDRDPVIFPDRYEYSNSTFDIRNRFNLNLFYQLPFGYGRAHLNHKGVLDEIAGGWSTDLVVQLQTGYPFSVTPNTVEANGGNAYAIMVGNPFAPGGVDSDPYNLDSNGNPLPCPTKVRTRTNWYNFCAFHNPLPGAYISPNPGPDGSKYTTEVPSQGTTVNGIFTPALNPSGQPYQYPEWTTGIQNATVFLGGKQDQVYGPGIERVNLSAFKNFDTYKRQYLQFRVDMFNVPNHPSFANPNLRTTNPDGGSIVNPHVLQQYTPDARFFQLALKYVF